MGNLFVEDCAVFVAGVARGSVLTMLNKGLAIRKPSRVFGIRGLRSRGSRHRFHPSGLASKRNYTLRRGQSVVGTASIGLPPFLVGCRPTRNRVKIALPRARVGRILWRQRGLAHVPLTRRGSGALIFVHDFKGTKVGGMSMAGWPRYNRRKKEQFLRCLLSLSTSTRELAFKHVSSGFSAQL